MDKKENGRKGATPAPRGAQITEICHDGTCSDIKTISRQLNKTVFSLSNGVEETQEQHGRGTHDGGTDEQL